MPGTFFAIVVSEAILVLCCYFRVAALAEFLFDGNLQGRLKRTAEELVKHDSHLCGLGRLAVALFLYLHCT